jgi:ATP/maltotriose-dependent transcriptional regulator MalT
MEVPNQPLHPTDRGLVRNRLLRLLDRADVTLVIAPAGSGKTTLLQQFAQHKRSQVSWYRAVSDDADPERLRGAVETLPALLAAREHRDHDSVFIIDDFQAVVSTPAEPYLERLIAGRPRGTRVLIATRQRPTMNISRAEFGSVAIVSADDLRFRTWEAEDLFRHVYRDPLLPQAAAALIRNTEGWAAGLHMFHLSTKGRSSHDRHTAITALNGRSRFLRSYLARTVVGELPPRLQQFLRSTCVFETLTADR